MEMNRWRAPGADENAISQGDPKEDRLSHLSRNPQTFKEYKLTQLCTCYSSSEEEEKLLVL